MEDESGSDNNDNTAYESESDIERDYISDDTIEYGSSDSDLDFDSSTYNIATLTVDQAPDLRDVDQTPWTLVVEPENGDFKYDFDDSSCGTKHIYNCSVPIDFLYLMFSPRLWAMVVENTNKYAIDNTIPKWKNVTVKSMKGFMSVIFNMGHTIKKNEINDYWSRRPCMNTPWFRYMFGRDHFK